MKLLSFVDRSISEIFILLIKIYQYTLSPDKGVPSLRLKGRVCMHQPHCSEYGIRVLKRYGLFRGLFMAGDRILHCTGGMKKIYDPEFYKIVFFSSAPIGVPFLEALSKDKRFEIIGVVTQCDKPVGRGMGICENIIKTAAKNIKKLKDGDIVTPIKINPEKSQEGKEFAERLKNKAPDFVVVIAYGKIIPQAVLDIPKIACINIHGSLLPKYRGASPIQSVFLDGEKETGITIMKMDATMDTGAMIEKLRFKIPFGRTCKNVIEKMQRIGPRFLDDVLRKYGKGLLGEVQQDDNEATYCGKISKESGLINPRKDDIESIYKKYCGFYLRPKIHFELDGKRIIIEELELGQGLFEENKNRPLVDGKTLNPIVLKMRIKPEGKKIMDWGAFVNGYMMK